MGKHLKSHYSTEKSTGKDEMREKKVSSTDELVLFSRALESHLDDDNFNVHLDECLSAPISMLESVCFYSDAYHST